MPRHSLPAIGLLLSPLMLGVVWQAARAPASPSTAAAAPGPAAANPAANEPRTLPPSRHAPPPASSPLARPSTRHTLPPHPRVRLHPRVEPDRQDQPEQRVRLYPQVEHDQHDRESKQDWRARAKRHVREDPHDREVQQDPPAGYTYQLVDTWERRPWSLVPGRYGQTADVSSAPDGMTFVLDARHQVVHVLDPDGTPLRVVPATDDAVVWAARRLDAGWDGTYFVLSEGPETGGRYGFRVDQYGADGARTGSDGRPLLSLRLYADSARAYRDLAVHQDGRLFLSRAGAGSPYIQGPGPTPTPLPPGRPQPNAIEVLAPDGRPLGRFGMEDLCMPDSLDVAADGAAYVVNLCPSTFGEPTPGPSPTPRPAYGLAGDARAAPNVATGHPAAAAHRQRAITPHPAAPSQSSDPDDEGVLEYGPDFQLRRKHRASTIDDVAVGPAGVFLARGVEVFALGEREPLYIGPSGRTYSAFHGHVVFRLDVPLGGGLVASMNHCYFQGLLAFDRPADRPAAPRLSGALDQPELEGPIYPQRVAAAAEVAVLQGRFGIVGSRPGQRYRLLPIGENQTVQLWRPEGALLRQLGTCGQARADRARDVAVDGRDVYTVDQSLLQRRPDDGFPAWSYWPGLADAPGVAARLQAVAARAGKVAILDVGAGRVVVLDRAMGLVGRWPVPDAAPVDLALSADRVYVAEGGRRRVLVYDLTGRRLAEWPLHGQVQGMDAGPEGDLFVLDERGWGFRYRPDGRLAAAWPMPEAEPVATDLAVGEDGRVFVSFVAATTDRGGPPGGGAGSPWLVRAGVWVFEAAVRPPAAPPPPAACLAAPDKVAAPRRVPLGATVDVRLTVEGRCPGTSEALQGLLVVDTSGSMGAANVLEAAKDGALALVSALDPRMARLGLVTFDERAVVVQPLARDFDALRRRIAALEPHGDTRLAGALDAALGELSSAASDPAQRRQVVVLTDGALRDDPLPAAAALRSAGVELWVLHYPSADTKPTDRERLWTLAGDAARVLEQPRPEQLTALARALTGQRDTPGLFETITVRDEIPANMRYVPDSAQPPARLEGRTLLWSRAAVAAAAGLALRYTLEPLEVGTWPTNVQATAAYTDALGFGGALVFPVPRVVVYAPPRENGIYLPVLARGSCLRRAQPLDVVLALDSSSSMDEPAASGGTKLAAARAAAGTFLDLLRLPVDRAALVTFDRQARPLLGLSGDRATLSAALNRVTTAPGTRIDLGLAAAAAVLSAEGRSQARPVVVLLTDGIQSAGSDGEVLAAAAALRDRDVLVYTIGLGTDAAPELLRAVATTPDRYFASPTVTDLEAIYRQVVERLACE